ncbi:SRPBCC family protein [Brachybacterium sp. MASK1Z-5]|uniref:SRPBCC family protein n=1 Tax=Brachybacterium halotolerans TaxID=2795215 RepID=A0ABS1BAZ3_9MICO|nr:SRPBCC family protein [Brachybacterium halotolerans]MBK0331784.1 SRPBCC family protein [Brachybacterium halotolerans]
MDETQNDAADAAPRVVSASRVIAAAPGEIFEHIADPALQTAWDGNDNLAEAASGQRVRGVGDVFAMTLTTGAVRENHVVDFDEGLRIAWLPAPEGEQPPGHLWRWDLEPLGEGRTRVIHTYDWTDLHDPVRQERARRTTEASLQASVDRLAPLLERGDGGAAR